MKIGNVELLHDLRMPLQLIYSCAQLLETEVQEEGHAREHLQLLMGSAVEMQQMLHKALDQNRMESESTRVCYVHSNIVVKTWEIFTRYQIHAQRQGIHLLFRGNTDRLEMALDEEKYGRILLNLLSNAMRFTPVGGKVEIVVQAMGDTVEVSVTDTGCGIASERLATIFEPRETQGGYGYGLYIAREYARCMGGSLRVCSQLGRGSTFTLSLPVHSVEAAYHESKRNEALA